MTDRIDVAFGITLCRATVLALAAAHIAHFSERLELKAEGTRLDECEHYRSVWISVRTAMNRGLELGAEEKYELYGAVTDGGYDALLTPDEFAMVHRVGRAS